jgi:hypothetical protein
MWNDDDVSINTSDRQGPLLTSLQQGNARTGRDFSASAV